MFQFLFLVLAGIISGAVAVCPRITTVTNLNPPLFEGDWRVSAMIRTYGGSPTVRCLHVDFRSNNWMQEPVSVTSRIQGTYDDTELPYGGSYASSIPSLSRPGRWTVNYNETQVELYIVYTDYMQYSLVVTCDYIPELDVDDINVFFLSRSKKPMPDPEVDNLYKLIENPDYGISRDNFFTVIGNEFMCPT